MREIVAFCLTLAISKLIGPKACLKVVLIALRVWSRFTQPRSSYIPHVSQNHTYPVIITEMLWILVVELVKLSALDTGYTFE
jgi:hypothetical protein